MNTRFDALVAGIQCIDIVASPVDGDVMRKDLTLTRSTAMSLGGDALNQAVVMSKLGLRTGLMGLCGRDRLGDVLVSQLDEYENLTVLNRRADVNTAISLVLVDESGERHFAYQPESNVAFGFEHIDEDAVRRADIVSVGGSLSLPSLDGEGMLRLLSLAKASGARTVMDFRISGYPWDRYLMKEVLARTDYILPSIHEIREMTGEGEKPRRMVEALRAMGAGNCVVKLGREGCYVDAEGTVDLIPARKASCVDTTGAGDTFVAAFVYGLSRHWDVERCAAFACAAGAIAVEHPGANAAIQNADQVLARMNA